MKVTKEYKKKKKRERYKKNGITNKKEKPRILRFIERLSLLAADPIIPNFESLLVSFLASLPPSFLFSSHPVALCKYIIVARCKKIAFDFWLLELGSRAMLAHNDQKNHLSPVIELER